MQVMSIMENLEWRTTATVAVTFVLSGLLSSFVTRAVINHSEQKPCFDTLYVYPHLDDDESSVGGLPAKREKFNCPHPDQKLELAGHGGVTCLCSPYTRRP